MIRVLTFNAVLFGVPIIWFAVGQKNNGPNCSSLEFVVQEAAECVVTSSAMLERRVKIHAVYGVPAEHLADANTCPKLLDNAESAGFGRAELVRLGDWMQKHESNVPSY